MHRWPLIQIPETTPATATLADKLGISTVLAQLLLNREIDAEEAQLMLQPNPALSLPTPPFLADLQACFLNHQHSGSRLAIFGDYDADGLSGTAVLSHFLSQSGFQVEPVLPTRSQGYGLNPHSIAELTAKGCRLLITVDCGISNAPEIVQARAAGLQVVITDHHGLPQTLPDAEFILHPAVLNLPELTHFSGAGMAWWLTTLLHPVLPKAPDPESLLDLALIGALADMTPLRGAHFALAKRGLTAMRQTQRPGLLALAKQKKIVLDTLIEDDLTFRMIPLLNAAGRLGSPQPALALLLSNTAEEAKQLAAELAEINTQRQQLCETVLEQALERLQTEAKTEKAIVLADARWPHGVLGITCSQLVERYHVPVVLMAIEGPFAKASVRAPKGYHVLEALQACEHLLTRYGGHEMAGGLTVATEKITAFSTAFNTACRSQQAQQLPKVIQAEMCLPPEELSLSLWESLRQLAPFGMGNPTPLFVSEQVRLEDIKPDRKSGKHFFAQLPTGLRIKGWQLWEPELAAQSSFDLLYSLERQTWRQQSKLELTLQALRPHQSAPMSLTLKQSGDPLTTDPLLPGYFTDGQTVWKVSFKPTDPEPLWLDARQNSLPLPGRWLYLCAPPDDALPIAVLSAKTVTGLALNHPPDNLEILQGFQQIALLPLSPLNPPLCFQDLWPILAQLQDHRDGLMSAPELQAALKTRPETLKICLNSLSDLGLLAYDSKRYSIQYTNQRYDLRQSKTFMSYLATQQKPSEIAEQWQTASFERLKNSLQSGTRAC